jgi:hypothetical protein
VNIMLVSVTERTRVGLRKALGRGSTYCAANRILRAQPVGGLTILLGWLISIAVGRIVLPMTPLSPGYRSTPSCWRPLSTAGLFGFTLPIAASLEPVEALR